MEKLEPFWFTKEHHELLAEFLKKDHDLTPLLENVRAEVDVSHTRLKLLCINPTFLGAALGYNNGAIPLYLSEEEKNMLLNLTELPTEIRGILK